LFVRLIEVDFRSLLIIRLFVQIQHILHASDKLGIHFRDAPLLVEPGLEFVFLSRRRTASRENDSAKPNSTTLPASKRRVQWLWPSGALLQAKAITWASCLPLSFGRAPGLGRSLS